MWAVSADGRPVVRKENPQFPPVDNTRGLSLVWQAEQQELGQERLKEAEIAQIIKLLEGPY